MLLGDIGHQAHLLPAEHHTGGVAWVGHEDGTGTLGDPGLNELPLGEPVALLRRGGNGHDLAAGDVDKRGVVGIEGLGHQYLVALIQDAGEDDLQRLAAAVGGQDVVAGNVEAQALVVTLGSLQEAVLTGSGRIGQDAVAEVGHGIEKLLGRLDIRLADVQVVDSESLFHRRDFIGVKLAHGRELAPLDLTGKFHDNASLILFRDALDACSAALTGTPPVGIKKRP